MLTGSNGQLGCGLQPHLDWLYGAENILYTDIQDNSKRGTKHYEKLNCNDEERLKYLVKQFKPDLIIHLAAILSASGERNPELAYSVNCDSFKKVIDVCRDNNIKIFSPSSIAAFGLSTPKDNTPNETIMRPSTMYGVTKVFNELIGDYYHRVYNVDFRCIRYPQVLSTDRPHGGTGDYSVDMFYNALEKEYYECYLQADEKMPMIYIDDLIQGTIQLLETDRKQLSSSVYNIQGCFFSPQILHSHITQYVPNFKVNYKPDFRQNIAASWPNSLDDLQARKDWGWNPIYTTEMLVHKMYNEVKKVLAK